MKLAQPGNPWPFMSTATFGPKPTGYCDCPGEREDTDGQGNCVICGKPQDPLYDDETWHEDPNMGAR